MKSLLALSLLASANPLLAAVSVPYDNDFSSPAAAFTSGGTGTWTVAGGTYNNSIPTDAPSSSVVQTTGLGGTTKQSFSVSTVVTAASGSIGTVGFALLGTGSNLTTSSFILADLFNSGTLRFRIFTNGSPVGSDSSITTTIKIFDIAASGNVTLSVTGIYNPDDSLTLTLSATQGSTTSSHSTTYSGASLPAGDWFGFRDRNNTGTGTVTAFNASYDSIAIHAIPEPSVMLLSAGFIGLAGLRRSRR